MTGPTSVAYIHRKRGKRRPQRSSRVKAKKNAHIFNLHKGAHTQHAIMRVFAVDDTSRWPIRANKTCVSKTRHRHLHQTGRHLLLSLQLSYLGTLLGTLILKHTHSALLHMRCSVHKQADSENGLTPHTLLKQLASLVSAPTSVDNTLSSPDND